MLAHVQGVVRLARMEARLPILAVLPAIAGIAGAGASIYGAVNNANATSKAANTQTQAAQQSAANFQPFLNASQGSLAAQMQLLGLGSGAGGQAGAIDQLRQSPLYQALYHNGEQSVLANGAATGGLRGGNTQASLYNLGANTLAQVYQNQFNNLGQITGLGENAAAGVGNGQLLGGQAAAGGIIRGATADNQIANTVAGLPSLFGNQQLLNALGLGGGISTTTSNILGPQYNIPSPAPSIGGLSTSLPGIGETFTPVL